MDVSTGAGGEGGEGGAGEEDESFYELTPEDVAGLMRSAAEARRRVGHWVLSFLLVITGCLLCCGRPVSPCVLLNCICELSHGQASREVLWSGFQNPGKPSYMQPRANTTYILLNMLC